ncbi:hypothetical protein [Novipirellula artificiosorum]|uniref:Uncharacterized protein n=1 Tax=Novipirellula artificiosorum TaxID=2528016 RepID=A0A5C6DPH2_9BACT|nr:hypothetical protein [Novipirellula artificiosorum]TWU39193.1 hypothetical protein Poly41_20150 [Novipirellula artificiosorum]
MAIRSIKSWLLAFSVALGGCLLFAAAAFAEDASAAKPTKVSVFGEAEIIVPAEFKSTPAKSRIIEHEFAVKPNRDVADSDESLTARLTFMAAGGDVDANLERWKGQFSGGAAEDQKVEAMNLGKWQVHVAELSGQFQERMGGGPFSGGKVVERTNHAMLGAIVVHPDGKKYFVKMVGPAETIKQNRDAFIAMIKSIHK